MQWDRLPSWKIRKRARRCRSVDALIDAGSGSVTDRLLRHIRPEQFRELILLLITIGALLFFWTQIPNYFDPRSINRLTVGFAIPWSWRSGR